MALGFGLLTKGCLVPAPPDFRDPEPERPNVSAELVVPPLGQILIAERNGPPLAFTIPFSSPDAVIVQFWLNWGLANEDYIGQQTLEFLGNEAERTYQGTWSVKSRIPQGCQQLTVLLSPRSNVPTDSPFRPTDQNLVARLSWWVNVDVPESSQQDLINCPGPSP